MGYFDKLIIPAIVQEAEVREKSDLNFENEDTIEQRNLAHEDLKAAKALSNVSKSIDSNDKRTKKALNRKAKQTAMEATEHAQKSVIFADDKQKKIPNQNLHTKLEKTHNNSFMQREQEKAGINILEKQDVKKLNSAIKKKEGDKSPYNAVRFKEQDIDDKSVDAAIEVAEKAITNLEKMVQDNRKDIIQIGDIKLTVDI